MSEAASRVVLDESWKQVLAPEFDQPYMRKLSDFLRREKRARKTIYPKGSEIFAALDFVPGQPGPLRCFEDCTTFLDVLPETVRAAGPDSDVVKRWHTFLVDVRAAVNGWGLEEHPAGGPGQGDAPGRVPRRGGRGPGHGDGR